VEDDINMDISQTDYQHRMKLDQDFVEWQVRGM
jgi:hypothetical protein